MQADLLELNITDYEIEDLTGISLIEVIHDAEYCWGRKGIYNEMVNHKFFTLCTIFLIFSIVLGVTVNIAIGITSFFLLLIVSRVLAIIGGKRQFNKEYQIEATHHFYNPLKRYHHYTFLEKLDKKESLRSDIEEVYKKLNKAKGLKKDNAYNSHVKDYRNYVVLKDLWEKYIEETKPKLHRLLNDVKNYNQVIGELVLHINTIDQLKEAGNPIEIKDREQILNAFRKIKEDFVRALKTERILRENPGFHPENFFVDAIPLFERLSFDEQAKEAERLVNVALKIGIELQEEMKLL